MKTTTKISLVLSILAILLAIATLAKIASGQEFNPKRGLPHISVQTDLESTRATVSCGDGKAPNFKTLTTPTKREIVILDCARDK